MPEDSGSSPIAGSIIIYCLTQEIYPPTPVESLPNLTQLPTEPSLLFNHGPQYGLQHSDNEVSL